MNSLGHVKGLKAKNSNRGETEMTDQLNEEVVNQWINGIPLKRGGTTEDVANLCLFLSSDLSTFITGQVINVDGGMLT